MQYVIKPIAAAPFHDPEKLPQDHDRRQKPIGRESRIKADHHHHDAHRHRRVSQAIEIFAQDTEGREQEHRIAHQEYAQLKLRELNQINPKPACHRPERQRGQHHPKGREQRDRATHQNPARQRHRRRARGGRCLHGPGAEAIWGFEEQLFDGIVMRSYLEHEEEPLKVLNGAHRARKPTGAVYVKVPNYGSVNRVVTGKNWCGIRLPDHVNYFTPSSLKAMAAKAGFSMQIKNPLNLMFDDNIHALLRRTG